MVLYSLHRCKNIESQSPCWIIHNEVACLWMSYFFYILAVSFLNSNFVCCCITFVGVVFSWINFLESCAPVTLTTMAEADLTTHPIIWTILRVIYLSDARTDLKDMEECGLLWGVDWYHAGDALGVDIISTRLDMQFLCCNQSANKRSEPGDRMVTYIITHPSLSLEWSTVASAGISGSCEQCPCSCR